MGRILHGTTYVREDEPCLKLVELNLIAPTNDGTESTDWFRFQIITVMRDNEPTEYRERLGRARDIKADPFIILGGMAYRNKIYIEETVGGLKQMANEMREAPMFDKRELVGVDRIKT